MWMTKEPSGEPLCRLTASSEGEEKRDSDVELLDCVVLQLENFDGYRYIPMLQLHQAAVQRR